MKYNEFIRLIERNGWKRKRQTGSHIVFEKDGRIYPVPLHGSKEVPKGTEKKTRRAMGLK